MSQRRSWIGQQCVMYHENSSRLFLLKVLSRVTSRLLGLGFLAFVSFTPGAYIVFLAAMIALKRPGYSWEALLSEIL